MKIVSAFIILIWTCLMASNHSFAQENENISSNSKNQLQQVLQDSAKVYVSFYIEKNGSISQVKIDKIECHKCSKELKKSLKSESIRVIKNMPNFKETAERRKFILPINYKL